MVSSRYRYPINAHLFRYKLITKFHALDAKVAKKFSMVKSSIYLTEIKERGKKKRDRLIDREIGSRNRKRSRILHRFVRVTLNRRYVTVAIVQSFYIIHDWCYETNFCSTVCDFLYLAIHVFRSCFNNTRFYPEKEWNALSDRQP